jgi:uncharacterized cupredoxin-like copper-binding protein
VLGRTRIGAAGALAAIVLVVSGCGGSDNKSNVDGSAGAPAATPSANSDSTAGMPGMDHSSMTASPSATPAGIVVHIDLVNGKPKVRPEAIVKVNKGETFTLIATSDKAYEIHIHGYDKKLELTPGQVGTETFVCDQTGTFEVEIEDTSTHLFSLQVR